MKIKTTPQEIWDEYKKGETYNSSIDLYDTVEKNQRFYHGDQWYEVNAPDLNKPVFNIMKRVISFYVATIVSDDIGVHITPLDDTPATKIMSDIIAGEAEKILERTKCTTKLRTNMSNCAIDGDTCMFTNFDADIETNQDAKGDVDLEIIDNTNIIFGNPYSDNVQKQPYILVVQRLFTDQVRDMAEGYGVSKDLLHKIVPDDDLKDMRNQSDLTTVITKFWKEKKTSSRKDKVTGVDKKFSSTTVHCTKVVQGLTLMEDTDMEYVNYPVAYMSWDRVKNSYHGRSPITGLIPNQIFVNKIYAMCMVYMTNMGFPKIFYDKTKLGKLTNDVTKGISVPNMDMAGKMMDAVKAPDFSNQIIQLIDSTIGYTKDFMGASDAALGELSGSSLNNTSAIVAVQQASSVPLEIQKLSFYQFVEDVVRSIVDVMACNYGIRKIHITENQAKELGMPPAGVDQSGMPVYPTTMDVDFSELRNFNYDINVEIGQSSYWSEQTQVQTMDNLFDKGIIKNPVTYLEGIPDKYIPNKRKLMEEVKKDYEQQQMMEQMQAGIQPGMMEGAPQGPQMAPGMAPVDLQQEPVESDSFRMKDGQDNRGGDNPQLQETYAKSKEFYQ